MSLTTEGDLSGERLSLTALGKAFGHPFLAFRDQDDTR